MSQAPRKSYRKVIPKSATVRIYTEEEQKLAASLKPKPPLPNQKSSFLAKNIPTEKRAEMNRVSIRNSTRLATKSALPKQGLSPLPNDEMKGYMRPKSSRPASAPKSRNSVTSRPSTSSRPSSKEKKKLTTIAPSQSKANDMPTQSQETPSEDPPEIETYKSQISQLEIKIKYLEETNLKLAKDKDRLVRDLDNHLKANIGERTGVDQLKSQFAEQHAQNASLIVHNRYVILTRSLKTQIYELEALIDTMSTSCSEEHAAMAKAVLKQLG